MLMALSLQTLMWTIFHLTALILLFFFKFPFEFLYIFHFVLLFFVSCWRNKEWRWWFYSQVRVFMPILVISSIFPKTASFQILLTSQGFHVLSLNHFHLTLPQQPCFIATTPWQLGWAGSRFIYQSKLLTFSIY